MSDIDGELVRVAIPRVIKVQLQKAMRQLIIRDLSQGAELNSNDAPPPARAISVESATGIDSVAFLARFEKYDRQQQTQLAKQVVMQKPRFQSCLKSATASRDWDEGFELARVVVFGALVLVPALVHLRDHRAARESLDRMYAHLASFETSRQPGEHGRRGSDQAAYREPAATQTAVSNAATEVSPATQSGVDGTSSAASLIQVMQQMLAWTEVGFVSQGEDE